MAIFGNEDKQAFWYKIACDGQDLIDKLDFSGGHFDETLWRLYAENTRVPVIENAAGFIAHCRNNAKCESARKQVEPRIPSELWEKYELGIFEVASTTEFEQKWVLLNQANISWWEEHYSVTLSGLKFLVVPSRGWDGEINEIGFRVANTDLVHKAFKWLFPYGNKATFGLHRCDRGRELLVVEGFHDYLAMSESGVSQVVGIGSVHILDHHMKVLGNNIVWCPDMDKGGVYSIRQYKEEDGSRRIALYNGQHGQDPFDVWLATGSVYPIYVE